MLLSNKELIVSITPLLLLLGIWFVDPDVMMPLLTPLVIFVLAEVLKEVLEPYAEFVYKFRAELNLCTCTVGLDGAMPNVFSGS